MSKGQNDKIGGDCMTSAAWICYALIAFTSAPNMLNTTCQD